jgi:hypothetical protein
LGRGQAKATFGIVGRNGVRPISMFSLSFDSNHRVVLAQFGGVLSTEDIEDFDKALAAFVSRHGFARGIFDFSSIQANAVPQSFLVRRARLPQILLGQERIIVAPQQEIYELACAYRINVRGVVRRIRKKFLQCDETFAEIDNFVGLGYRWANPTTSG